MSHRFNRIVPLLLLALATIGCQSPRSDHTLSEAEAYAATSSAPVTLEHAPPERADENGERWEGYVVGAIPRATNGPQITVLVNKGFLVGYAEDWGVARWVAYRLFRVGDVDGPGRRDFAMDPRSTARIIPFGLNMAVAV